jgi:hypothetical protein
MSWNPDLGANNLKTYGVTNSTKFLSAMKTIHLVVLPVIISLLPIVALVWLGSAGYRDTPAQTIFSGMTFFLWGCTGLPMIVRKEIPWLRTAPGWMASVQGIVFLTIGWGIALGFAILLLNSILGNTPAG